MKKLLLLLWAGLLAPAARAQAPASLPLAPVVRPRSILLPDTTTARAIAISGTVREAGGPPLPGITVLLKGTMRGTSTDAQGRYRLLVPRATRATLVFSMVGYATQQRRVGKEVVINVALKPANEALK